MSIKLHSKSGKVYEGEIYAIDPVTKSVALKTDGSYIVMNPSEIAQIKGDITSLREPQLAELGISIHNIEKKEAAALKQAEKNIDSLNSNVSNDVQTLYDKISIIYPCSWRNVSIVVLDEYVIEPPYEEVKVLEGCDGTGIDRVKKILEGERKKLNL
mmetsp:Transcript_24479/g.40820  ORF Transcript_24479/g.40820 Transcript_24479/m.40820 type:complete len:157 (+) Transcript_24479:170-640(+)|eukprot:CAMPEP_0174975576 /NCGR_PEP_ID=MMETSP0004_2-20121128/12521_1 /TAXON_ID=420556 /ORGANISM="Ochromonas sp., Strain CCMP1393" /LENGTH=156 /DNA_ID=CAMNT_0016226445 /DNA_START=166 /DNA_END=636 /DNA_ORIENTATION=-